MPHQDLPRADYGIDAPGVQRRFFTLGLSGVIAGAALLTIGRATDARLPASLAIPLFWMGGTCLLTGGVMRWGSLVGKLRLRDRTVDALGLRGDERVLDVGCGHGLMLLAAARRLTSGRAIGVDIWQAEDQAGNSPEATMRNARAEGVEDRVELRDGDARALPLDDASIDVVLSSWALHNIYDPEGRRKAIEEIVRVLKPGGKVALIDIRNTDEYVAALRDLGMQNVRRSGPSFVFVTPSYTVQAVKPLR